MNVLSKKLKSSAFTMAGLLGVFLVFASGCLPGLVLLVVYKCIM